MTAMTNLPFWWDDVIPVPMPSAQLPASADVVVVGAGYTGLHAALRLASAGRSVVVLEAGRVLQGASSRNGGMCGDLLKPSFGALVDKYGHPMATRIYGEARDALLSFEPMLKEHGISCDFQKVGRINAALSQTQLEGVLKEAEVLRREVGIPYEVLSRQDLERELGTKAYVGARLLPHHAGLHPAKYARDLLRVVGKAGAAVHEQTAMTGFERDGGRVRIHTARGTILARELIVATNGYTGAATPKLRRRVVPVTSYMIATEVIEPELMRRLFPTRRMATDTNRLLCYYRPSPEGDRILFGGRPFYTEVSPERSAARLRDYLVQLFPELANVSVTHSWHGNIGYSFDHLPHLGQLDGVHYAGGYCGSGVVMSAWLGSKLAHRVLGSAEGKTAFAEIGHKTHPLYHGRPWFLPLVQAWYQAGDLWRRA